MWTHSTTLTKIAKQNKHEYFTSVHVSEPQVTRVHRTSVYSNRRLVQSLGGLGGYKEVAVHVSVYVCERAHGSAPEVRNSEHYEGLP